MDEREDSMDLDLNLLPSFSPSLSSDVLEERLFRERVQRLEEIATRSRGRWRRRWRQGRVVQPPRSDILMEVIVNPSLPPPSSGIERLQTGEGSVRAEERSNEIGKSCRGNPTHLSSKALEKAEDLEESNDLKSGFFDCNICFDMASDPVLTSCGHLFCWPCLHQWINVHSETKECPVCKGEVTEMNITPIYGRGSNKTHEAEEEEEEEEEVKELKIPPRPHARRIESVRQSIQRVVEPSFTFEELLLQYDNVFDAHRGFNPSTQFPERLEVQFNSGLNQHRAQDDIIDLTQDNVVSSEAEGSSRRRVSRRPFLRSHLILDNVASPEVEGSSRRRVSRRPLLRPHLPRASASYFPSLPWDGRPIEEYFQGQVVRRTQTQSPSIDDRDSFSSIVAVINSDSQTVDTAIEIDSMVSPTSSSRRRRDTSSVSDVNHGVTRSSRRRR